MKSIITFLFLMIVATVAAQQITKNGSRYEFENVIYTSYEIGSILEKDYEAKAYYDIFRSRIKKGKKIVLVGGGVIASGIAYYYMNEKGSVL